MRLSLCSCIWLVMGCCVAFAAQAQSISELPALLPPPASEAAAPAVAEAVTLPVEEVLPAPASAAPELGPVGGLGADGAPPNPDAMWFEPSYWLEPSPWDTAIELGLNGSSGTSESLSVRTGGYIKRESRFSKLDLTAMYNRTTNGGAATQNNAQIEARNDWLLDDNSPWTLFATGNLFYDEFQSFDLQTSANTGIGYRFAHEPGLDLIGRLGGGASREFGGPDDRTVPESLVGFEYSQQLSATQRFYGKLDYYPEWEELGEYRLVADTGWEIELLEPSNLSLKVSATDRYDSTPNGADPHLVNYSVLLLLKL
jgi:putative salt-induced outer membrane protein YdiY